MASSPMKQDWKGLGSYGTVGLEVVLSMLFGLFIGRWMDSKLGTEPVFAVIWFFFGVAAGGRSIWRTWKHMQAEAAREEREQGNPKPLYDPGERATREAEEAEMDARWRLDSGEKPDGEGARQIPVRRADEPAEERDER